MIISLLVTGPPKKYRLTRYSLLSLKKKELIILSVVTVCPKKVTIKSLVVIFPYKKVSIIRYSILFHIKSNNNFGNRYFSYTKYVSLTLIVTNPHTKYNVEQSVGWLKERNIDWYHFWPPLNLAGQPLENNAKIVILLPLKKSNDFFVRSLVLLEKNDYFVTFFLHI